MLNNIEFISLEEFELDMSNLLKKFELDPPKETTSKGVTVSNKFISCFLRLSNYITDLMIEEHGAKDYDYSNYKRTAILFDTLSGMFQMEETIKAQEETIIEWDNRNDVPEEERIRVKKELSDSYKSLEDIRKKFDSLFDPDVEAEWEYSDEWELPDFLC